MKFPMIATVITLIGYGLPASAQDLDYDPEILSTCIADTNVADRAICIGQAADACMKTEAGQSTVGIGMCISSEWQQWDERLNTAYQDLLIQQAEVAADNAAFNRIIPDAVDLLRDMQRGWTAYRDAACDWEMVQWGGGTGGGPASAACMMRLTAQQTLFLEDHL
jgi:uncharacterized protein YecT (DUF1311 family)